MTKYLINRILRSVLSVIIVVAVIMILIYSLMNKQQIFAADPVYTKQKNNQKETYQMQQWERFGYLDYVPFADYLTELQKSGELNAEDHAVAAKLGKTTANDSDLTKKYAAEFKKYYEKQGYEVVRLPGLTQGNTKKWRDGGEPKLYAYKEVHILVRLWDYITGIFQVDNIHYVQEDVGERGLTFTFYDPAYGGEKFSPAIIGNGTQHKYLLYFNDRFPYIHQNLLTVQLGTSFSVKKGVDVFNTMTDAQGALEYAQIT